MEKIQYLDKIPDDIANDIAQNAARNRLIVNTYLAKQDVYGQTIVFAININHSIALSKLFWNLDIQERLCFIDFIWEYERDYVALEYRKNKRKFILVVPSDNLDSYYFL